MSTSRREFIGLAASAGLGACLPRPPEDTTKYPGWKPGELDIHFIQTGRGEQTFFILPDGTTMLVDCGDYYHPPFVKDNVIPLQPSGERLGGDWVARYVSRLIPQKSIDYFLLTHWHGDHSGSCVRGFDTTADGRKVCGITKFAETFDIRHYFDHQYPKFACYGYDADPQSYEMVRPWIEHMHNRCGMEAHSFEVGADDQLRLLGSDARKYRDVFRIRNLHTNCRYWDGHGKVTDYAPEYIRREPKMNGKIYENSLSLGFRLEYGDFRAYFGGDIDYPDYEEKLAPTIGKVDVCKENHHGCPSSMGAALCQALQAKLYMSSIWSPKQLARNNLRHMTSRELYPGKRYICPGYFPPARRDHFKGEAFLTDFLPVQGHTVVKVDPMGKGWQFFILSATDESMKVLYRERMV